MSILMTCLLAVIAWRLHIITAQRKAGLPVPPSA
jgi:hypothetical protein